jgi:hypothetical protein
VLEAIAANPAEIDHIRQLHDAATTPTRSIAGAS